MNIIIAIGTHHYTVMCVLYSGLFPEIKYFDNCRKITQIKSFSSYLFGTKSLLQTAAFDTSIIQITEFFSIPELTHCLV